VTVRARVAVVSFHTSPMDQAGEGDSGGMNVYLRSVTERLSRRGVAVDIFTRCSGRRVPEVHRIHPHTRVIQVPAGPCAPVSRDRLPDLVGTFVDRMVRHEGPYDLVHAHYWLSGHAAREAKRRWSVPMVASFHTLGAVKNRALVPGERPDPVFRLMEERDTIRESDLLFAPTTTEAAHLIHLGAPAERIRVITPGVDATRFFPRDKDRAKAALGLAGRRVVLFVGRLQSLKAPDLAVRAVGHSLREGTEVVLLVVGGPSGTGASTVPQLQRLARREGVGHLVRFLSPVAHAELPAIYAAADVLLMPSRTESFGLVALEAQACGIPVVAAGVGGLPHVVADGRSGLLVRETLPEAFAERLLAVLGDRDLALRLGKTGVARASRLSWDRTTSNVLDAYAELHPALAAAAAG
jgi:D-inositol-3-phosphate glycosyltransferase